MSLRVRLKKTYSAFYDRHGTPWDLQERAGDAILSGHDVLIEAPTAAGKTEAAIAPLVERHLECPSGGVAALVVCPTRALVNDLHRRLDPAFRRLDVPLGRRTTDHRDQSAGSLRSFTILTPESFDSRLSREAASFRKVKAVVLDDIHELVAGVRGDQLRILLSRLDRVASEVPQRVALSATLDAPERFCKTFLTDAVMIREEGRRKIRAKVERIAGFADLRRVAFDLARKGAAKILVFCNSRREVEQAAGVLKDLLPFRGAVYAHHGSLGRTVRTQAETEFERRDRALLAATSTLELGVDIGDVDAAILVRPPRSVASLLQRTGRAGRRSGISIASCLATDEQEELLFKTLLRLAAKGDLAEDPHAFRRSVLQQQALSLLYQSPGRFLTPQALHERLPMDLAETFLEDRLLGFLEALADADWLIRDGKRKFRAGRKAERAYRLGVLHANMDARQEIPVVDRETGRIEATVAAFGQAEKLQVAGRAWRVVLEEPDRMVVTGSGEAAPPTFAGKGMASVSMRLASTVRETLGIPEDEWPMLPWEGELRLLHFLGSIGGRLLASLIAVRLETIQPRADALSVLVPVGCLPENLLETDREEVMRAMQKAKGLRGMLGLGRYHHLLPEEEALEGMAEASGLDAFLDACHRGRIVPYTGDGSGPFSPGGLRR